MKEIIPKEQVCWRLRKDVVDFIRALAKDNGHSSPTAYLNVLFMAFMNEQKDKN